MQQEQVWAVHCSQASLGWMHCSQVSLGWMLCSQASLGWMHCCQASQGWMHCSQASLGWMHFLRSTTEGYMPMLAREPRTTAVPCQASLGLTAVHCQASLAWVAVSPWGPKRRLSWPGSSLPLLCALELTAFFRQAATSLKLLLVFLHGRHGKLVGLLQLCDRP